MSRQFCSAHIACHCMVLFYGISHAANLSPWRSHLRISSGESGGCQEIVTPEYYIPSLIVCLTVSLEGSASRSQLSIYLSKPVFGDTHCKIVTVISTTYCITTSNDIIKNWLENKDFKNVSWSRCHTYIHMQRAISLAHVTLMEIIIMGYDNRRASCNW